MTDKGKHTELPWKIQEKQVEDFAIVVGNEGTYNICQANMLTSFEPEIGEWESNAQFIVRACNNFEALREALQSIMKCKRGEHLPAEVVFNAMQALKNSEE